MGGTRLPESLLLSTVESNGSTLTQISSEYSQLLRKFKSATGMPHSENRVPHFSSFLTSPFLPSYHLLFLSSFRPLSFLLGAGGGRDRPQGHSHAKHALHSYRAWCPLSQILRKCVLGFCELQSSHRETPHSLLLYPSPSLSFLPPFFQGFNKYYSTFFPVWEGTRSICLSGLSHFHSVL